MVLIDIVLLNTATLFANFLRFDFVISTVAEYHLNWQMAAVTITGIFSLLINGAHRGLIRHTSQSDSLRIVKAVTLSVMLLASFNYALVLLGNAGHPLSLSGVEVRLLIPNSVLLIFFPVALFMLLFFQDVDQAGLLQHHLAKQG